MPKKIQDCTKAHLISIDLPVHGDSYTVISHESVMDYAFTELAAAGFGIVSEEYRATADGQIAQGIYRLNYNSDPELSMMFAWTNSYNKQVRFKCGVGAYVNQTGTVMVCGDMGSWARKHTGSADEETIQTIKDQITDATMYYNQLVSDKEAMKSISMTKRKQAQLLGILFAEYQILTTEQASMIRNQMDRPGHVFEDTNSLWAFYNYVTTALQHSHPKTWMEDQRVLHYFISTVNNFVTSQPTPQVQPVVEATVDPLTVIPNQTNILDQIAEIEAREVEIHVESDQEYLERVADIEGEPEELVNVPEEIMDALMNAPEIDASEVDMSQVTWEAPSVPGNFTLKQVDETVIYTDPAGNTFEAPIVPPCAAHDFELDNEEEVLELEPETEEHDLYDADIISREQEQHADLDSLKSEEEITLPVDDSDDFDFNFANNDQDDDDDIPDFF